MTQPPFYQHAVVATGKILDRGVIDGVKMLHRTTVNTPPAGYYYVNEDRAFYIFARADWAEGLTISFVDTGQSGRKKTQTERVGKQL